MTKKVDMALWLESIATRLAALHSEMARASDMWAAKGYASGGGDPIVDGDISDHDITAAQLASMITTINNYEKLFTNQVPTQNTYNTWIHDLADNK